MVVVLAIVKLMVSFYTDVTSLKFVYSCREADLFINCSDLCLYSLLICPLTVSLQVHTHLPDTKVTLNHLYFKTKLDNKNFCCSTSESPAHATSLFVK